MSRTASLRKTSDWLLSWVYDAVDKKIYTGRNHIDIIPEIPEGWEKARDGHIICGWYNKDWDDVYPSIATDTVSKDYADEGASIANEAQKAAMKYWHDEGLDEEYNYTTCPECGNQVSRSSDHEHYCSDCDEYYYNCDYYYRNRHNQDFCAECNEHVPDIDEHNEEYHWKHEPWMPEEGETIQYKGKQWFVYESDQSGLTLTPPLAGGKYPATPLKGDIYVTWDEYEEDLKRQKGWIETHPDQFSIYGPKLKYEGLQGTYWSTQAPNGNKLVVKDETATWYDPYGQKIRDDDLAPYTLKSEINSGTLNKISFWQESLEPAIIYCTDLHDDRVFAKIARDYISLMQKNAQGGNNWLDSDDLLDYQKGNNIYQGLNPSQINEDDDFLAGGYARQDNDAPTEEMPQLDEQSKNPMIDVSKDQPDDPRMLDVYRNRDSKEYRWSYDGTQLHMWRVFNRNTFGPSHYDMFGAHGYENHSQGRVYVSPDGKVGMLYWQITHPECEQVLNEWCMKTFNKLPDYVYRAYGPYMGTPVSRWDFPVVEVSGLPIGASQRWWEQPGGYPGMKKKDYPAPKQKKSPAEKWNEGIQNATQEVNNLNQNFNQGRGKRRKRTRSRKYRNRSFRR